jgi:hypothetical protein
MKLGKDAKAHDDRTLKLRDFVSLPAVPASAKWSANISAWEMMLNDTLGDCTIAAPGHIIMSWTNSNGKLFTPTNAEILAAYEKFCGYVNGEPSTDRGGNMLHVQRMWRKYGIGGHKIGAFLEAHVQDFEAVKGGVAFYGATNIGLQLPASAQAQSQTSSEIWDVTNPALTGNAAPGSWGGHDVPIIDYDSEYAYVVTWGGLKRMTWRFFDAYSDEAYVDLSSDWVTGAKPAPSGLNLTALQNALASL